MLYFDPDKSINSLKSGWSFVRVNLLQKQNGNEMFDSDVNNCYTWLMEAWLPANTCGKRIIVNDTFMPLHNKFIARKILSLRNITLARISFSYWALIYVISRTHQPSILLQPAVITCLDRNPSYTKKSTWNNFALNSIHDVPFCY